MRKSTRPKMFENAAAPKRHMDNVAAALVQKTLDSGIAALNKEQPKDIQVKRMPKSIEVTEKRLKKLGVIDMKPLFAQSNKRKEKKGGGWYLVVPISRSVKSMSRRMYDKARATPTDDTGGTVISDFMYDRRRVSDSSMLNYTPKSNNMKKERKGKKRHAYVAYRTVSDKSPANSWILNRDKVNEEETSKTFVKNVDRLMKWKMKNGWR